MARSIFLVVSLLFWACHHSAHAQSLPGTQPLTTKDDLAQVMVKGIEKYLDRELAASPKKRKDLWKPDASSPQAWLKSVEPNRERLKKILGVVDPRVPVTMEFVGGPDQPALLAQTKLFKVYRVRWPVLPGVEGEGLLLEPEEKVQACVVAIPDADQTPEMLVGLAPGLAASSQFARRLAENGCRVVVPVLMDRQDTWSGNAKIHRFTNQTHREFIYRMAFEMGRHVIGYEIQKVLAVVDWYTRDKDHPSVGVYGFGEGGLLAFYAGALDTRIKSTVTSCFVGPREGMWQEPIYRNVWGLVKEFGDGEVQQLFVPRSLIIEQGQFQVKEGPPLREGRRGAAPGSISQPNFVTVMQELARINFPKVENFPREKFKFIFGLGISDQGLIKPPGLSDTLEQFLQVLAGKKVLVNEEPPTALKDFNPLPRQKRQFDQLVDYTQKLLPEAARKRQDFFWNKLDTSGLRLDARLEKFEKSQEPLRKFFWEEIIGKLPEPTMPLNPRTRLIYDTPKWKGYEVVLDVYEDVISYGILCVPNDLKPGEKRPCIVCQHGLEGRPTDVVNPREKTKYYNSFGSQLADMGFIVFAPQNPYIFQNQFRQLVRRANPLQLTLYSFIVRQHQRILDFLETLPFVDAQKIAYYGLSYGGKVAMRIPAILGRYCLSICSGDFNEWIWKNITLDWSGSYMFTGEYEMFEFDLGNTFNYAEMAALIAPRPFMVERGHSDGVGLDEYVAFEFAKVRRLYAKLGIPDRTDIEFFTGGHEIHLQGTLAFLQKHLHWPPKK
jgi:dienelactone hydrolase